VLNPIGFALLVATLASDDVCTRHLDEQLAWHRHYGLPLPPPQAALVWFEPEPVWPPLPSFQLRPGLGFSLDGRTVLDSFGESDPVASVTFVKPDPSLVRDAACVNWLRFAVACHERGWKPLALAAVRRYVLANEGWGTNDQIADDAWRHWARLIHSDPGTPLPVIAKYLKRAQRSDVEEEFVRAVEETAKPRNSPPDSDDALIDALLELTGYQPFDACRLTDFRTDPLYLAVARRGLDGVPALIAHLDDPRVTRIRGDECHICRNSSLRVKDIVLDLLVQLHGGKFKAANRHELLKEIALWYAAALKLGEAKYLTTRLLGEDDKQDVPREMLLRLIADKYPERLPDVFRKIIDTRPRLQEHAWMFARAIEDGPVPPPDKHKLFEYAARSGYPVRAAGIHFLRPYDPERAKKLLLAALAEPSSEVELARTVAEGTDPDEWRAFGLALRQAHPLDRIFLLDRMLEAEAPAARKLRLALAAEYLTDDDAYYGSSDGRPHPSVVVQNVVAWKLAEILASDTFLTPRDEEWPAFRAAVRARVDEELRR
jgi:hypothetical protein